MQLYDIMEETIKDLYTPTWLKFKKDVVVSESEIKSIVCSKKKKLKIEKKFIYIFTKNVAYWLFLRTQKKNL